MQPHNLRIARLTWQRFCDSLRLLVQSEFGPKALRLSSLLCGCMIAINGLNVINSYVGRDFMSAIEHKHLAGFKLQSLLYLVVFAGSTLAAVFYRFTVLPRSGWAFFGGSSSPAA
jgi:vitamin B12/bleomycin/antimicrobial peptide transport system ATP-binding/permease protein